MTENALVMRRKQKKWVEKKFGSKKFWDPNIQDLIFFQDSKFFNFLLINKTFSVISNWIYSPFNNLTYAQPYLERTFTWNSSVAQLSLACFVDIF